MDSSSSSAANTVNMARSIILNTYFVILILGVIGNGLNILVFNRLKIFRGNRWAFYLTFAAIVDIGYIIVLFASNFLQTINTKDPQTYTLVWCRIRSILFQTLTLTSFFTICFAACDQFFSTSYRLNMRQICTFRMAQCFTFGNICIWFLHSIIYGVYLQIQGALGCIITNPIMSSYSSSFFYSVLYGPLPLVIAVFFSLLAFRNVRRIVRRQVPIERRQLDQQMTAMILIRVCFFVVFALPYSIYKIYTIITPIPSATPFQSAIKQLLQVLFTLWTGINFTCAFYIFVASSPAYRRQLRHLLVKRYWRRWFGTKKNRINPENRAPTASEIEFE
ncbi:unnamed protein product [Adineta steineri]|uniref:G-protein coupled receptors family 1 profile domain-containing protein n=1 Tax=Adineta steineri TaxID=433720 RepID=A0A815QSG4_9BILA|nr:unnamed protein product [Adineta steineri]CAF3768055.1 unnamed protein product [Adineta steineri]